MPTPKKSTKKAPAVKLLPLVKNDPYLIPFAAAIAGRHEDAVRKEKELTAECGSLKELANGHEYFGMHRNAKGGWTFREWAPNATRVVLIGDFSDWKAVARYELARKDNGVWELDLPNEAIHHGDLYKLLVSWQGGEGERIPPMPHVWCRTRTHISFLHKFGSRSGRMCGLSMISSLKSSH